MATLPRPRIPKRRPQVCPDVTVLKEEDQLLIGETPEEPAPITALMYARYAHAVKTLNKLYDEEFQPQKGLIMRRVLEAATQRMIELKEYLVAFDMSEFHYVDGAYIQLKLVPQDFEIMTLQGLPGPRDPDIQDKMERLMIKGERIYIPPPPPPPPEEEKEEEETEAPEEKVEEDAFPRRKQKPKSESVMVIQRPYVEVIPVDPVKEALKAAVTLIQAHERARQGRLEFFDDRELWMLKNRRKKFVKIPDEIGNKNATMIQKIYRGFIARRDFKNREKQRRLMIGMDMPYWIPHEERDKLKELIKLKRELREQKLKNYIDSIGRERERFTKLVAPGLAEDIADEIRYWFRTWYDEATAFDKIPDPELGGTILVIRGETMTPLEYLAKQEAAKAEKERLRLNPALAQKMKQDKEKAKKAEQDRIKKEIAKAKKEAQEAKDSPKEEQFCFKESVGLNNFIAEEDNYAREWREEMEVEENPLALPIMDPTTNDICYELQLKVRAEVDVLMDLELQMLQKALCLDLKKKYKKPKKKKPKKVKPIIERSIEDMFQELYDNGIIRTYPETSLDEYYGEYVYSNMELRERPGPPLDPQPGTLDVRQVLMNTCILPLAGEMVGNPRPKAVCIAGPKKSGKKTLVNAICSISKSVMFDVTPKVLKGKYKEKEEKKMFIIMLNTMLRVLQPSVIFLDGAEKPFYKTVPKPEKKEEPKKLKPILQKGILKKILPEERIMLIATTKQPWAASGPFVKFYDRFIMIPRTNYGTVFKLWTDLLMRYPAIPRDINISSLTKMTIGYPVPSIKKYAEEVLTPRRILQLSYKPFHPKEIIEYLVQGKGIEPVTEDEGKKFLDFYNKKVPLGKKRTEVTEELEAQRILAALQAAKAAKKK